MDSINKFTDGYNIPPPDFSGEEKEYEIDDATIEIMYARVFYGLGKAYSLVPIENHLVALIISLSNKRGYCYMSHGSFAKVLSSTPQTIGPHLRELERKGVIEEVPNKGRSGVIGWKLTDNAKAKLHSIQERLDTIKRKKVSSGSKRTFYNNYQ